MYKKIMVPVDLEHTEQLSKAIDTAINLAKHYSIPVCLVGVTAETPTAVAHTPAEFAKKLAEFGASKAQEHGLDVDTASYSSHDPTTDLDRTLIKAAGEQQADLIVMASHVPGASDHIFAPHAAAVASHAGISVFVVR